MGLHILGDVWDEDGDDVLGGEEEVFHDDKVPNAGRLRIILMLKRRRRRREEEEEKKREEEEKKREERKRR